MIETALVGVLSTLQVLWDACFFPILYSPAASALCVVLAFSIDRVFGEPKFYHPIVGLGKLARAIDQLLYKRNARLISRGVFAAFLVHLSALILVVAPIIICLTSLSLVHGVAADVNNNIVSLICLYGWSSVVLYVAIAPRSLVEHIGEIHQALMSKDIPKARYALSMVVSRDTRELSETDLARAGIESLTENENDGVIAPLFWFLCFGPLGAIVFKVANTLDSMWGYRNLRYNYFGRFSARLDDVLGYIPARMTALMFASPKGLFLKAMAQGKTWYSPNAGPVMAAGALALGVGLGGRACYNGEYKRRPVLGTDKAPDLRDLGLGLQMVNRLNRSVVGFFFVLGVGFVVLSPKGVL